MTQFPIAPEDIVAAGGFITVIVGALAFRAIRVSIADSPRARMRQRALEAALATGGMAASAEAPSPLHVPTPDSLVTRLIARITAEADQIGGVAALRVTFAAGLAAAVSVGVLANLSGLPLWLAAALVPLGGLAGAVGGFRLVTLDYRRRFLSGFPDALELIVRAVRAGVPVVHAVRTAGRELPYPVGREFRLMSDALSLGLDQSEVMETAAKRIKLPDFQFFTVCLELQRETGGPLAETLENLAAIIRARRETRLKTKALTAHSRSASKIIAMVPAVTMGGIQTIDPDYLSILFNTEAGNHVLWACLALIVAGLAVIARMSRIEE